MRNASRQSLAWRLFHGGSSVLLLPHTLGIGRQAGKGILQTALSSQIHSPRVVQGGSHIDCTRHMALIATATATGRTVIVNHVALLVTRGGILHVPIVSIKRFLVEAQHFGEQKRLGRQRTGPPLKLGQLDVLKRFPRHDLFPRSLVYIVVYVQDRCNAVFRNVLPSLAAHGVLCFCVCVKV